MFGGLWFIVDRKYPVMTVAPCFFLSLFFSYFRSLNTESRKKGMCKGRQNASYILDKAGQSMAQNGNERPHHGQS